MPGARLLWHNEKNANNLFEQIHWINYSPQIPANITTSLLFFSVFGSCYVRYSSEWLIEMHQMLELLES